MHSRSESDTARQVTILGRFFHPLSASKVQDSAE